MTKHKKVSAKYTDIVLGLELGVAGERPPAAPLPPGFEHESVQKARLWQQLVSLLSGNRMNLFGDRVDQPGGRAFS